MSFNNTKLLILPIWHQEVLSGIDDLFLVLMEDSIILLCHNMEPSTNDMSRFNNVSGLSMGSLAWGDLLVNVGGDVFVHTVDDIVSMLEMLKRDRSGHKCVEVSEAIKPSVREQQSKAAQSGRARFCARRCRG